MQKKKYAVVTYTTFDNKVRKQKQWMGKNGEAIFSNIIEYLATGKWPEEPEGWVRRLEWGLERHTPYKLSPGTTFQYAYRDCHTAAQMSYYNGLLKTCVIGSLAKTLRKTVIYEVVGYEPYILAAAWCYRLGDCCRCC